MHEKSRDPLRSGKSGKKATSRTQTIAMVLSEARKAGAKVPKKNQRLKRKQLLKEHHHPADAKEPAQRKHQEREAHEEGKYFMKSGNVFSRTPFNPIYILFQLQRYFFPKRGITATFAKAV